jgi:aminoglycoside phosphotransferase (APT) family kinase protein
MTAKDLDQAITPHAREWIGKELGGRVIGLKRGVARREAYAAEIEHDDGRATQAFIRIDRAALKGDPGARSLKREAELIRYLCAKSEIPTQKILGWSDEFQIAIQSMEPGRADLCHASHDEQHSVMNEFMGIMAKMHMIDIESIDVAGFDVPPTAEAHSLQELESVEGLIDPTLSLDSSTILGSFGRRWLRNHVPTSVERTVLVQGDTGAGNFLFEDGRVTAVVDWEWAHLGDPMEDLGNVWTRDIMNPSCSGDLTPYFEEYARKTGFTLDRSKLIYYLVHQLVRSVIAIPSLARGASWRSPVAMNLGYQGICDLLCCQAIGLQYDLDDVESEPLGIVEDQEAGELYRVVANQLEKGLEPQLADEFARSTANGAAELTRYLERRHTDGPRADALELGGINALLGESHHSLDAARAALNEEMMGLAPDSEPEALKHCWGVAKRNMELMAPLVDRWSFCQIAKVDV